MFNKVHFNILLFTSLLLLGSTLQILLPQTKKFDIQVDHIYQQTIPSFFQLYQSTQLKNLTRLDSPQTLVSQTICTIQDQEENQYIQQSQYYHFNIADPEQFYLGRKKVASFDDLTKLSGIIDTIVVDDKVFVLYQNGFYTSYTVNPKNGKIKRQHVKHIQRSEKNIDQSSLGTYVFQNLISFGDLLYDKENPDYLVFFGEQQAMIMNKTQKEFQLLKGYDPIGQSYSKAIMSKNNIFVATGFQGVFVYEIDFEKKEIKLKQKFRPFYKDREQEVFLMVSEIVYDSKSMNLIIVDPSEGIYWSSIPSVEQSKIQCQPKPILIQNCENLNLMMEANIPVVIATCPQLLIVTLDSKRQHLNDEITFYPHSVIANQSRILLFGQYRYAVYDIETSLVQQGQSPRKIDFVQIIGQQIVIVNGFAIYAGKILPDQEKIVCAINGKNAQKLIGTYQAILQIQGICSQLYSSQFIEKTNVNNQLLPSTQNLQKLQNMANVKQNCFLKYNIEFSINNSAQVSYIGEIITGIIIAWILIGGLIAYCVKDIKIEKEYNQLLQENVPSATDKNKEQESKIQDRTNEQIFVK